MLLVFILFWLGLFGGLFASITFEAIRRNEFMPGVMVAGCSCFMAIAIILMRVWP